MSIRQQIMESIQPIQEGKTITITCPNCGTRGKFTATVRGDTILFNCYRSSCNTRGKFSLNLSGQERISNIRNRNMKSVQENWQLPSFWIDGIGDTRCLTYMHDNNLMQAYESGKFRPMYDPAERRFVFPIRDGGSKIIGAIGRTLINAYPKAMNYNSTYTKPFMCGTGSVGVLVEDCASAVAATRKDNIVGIAMLGTTIRPDFIRHLSDFDVVVIALDKDAYSRSLRLNRIIQPYIEKTRIIRLNKDIKNMTDPEYAELMVNF